MNTSLSWIKTYVPDLDVTAQEYTDAMTLTGTKVEGFTELDADLDKIVIGQIDKIEKHPDADKLIICQVNIGTESVQIVTGAPNVKEGDKVRLFLMADVLQAARWKNDSRRYQDQKRQTPWRGVLWYDVLYRGTWKYQRNVSGSTGIRNLYFS